MNTRRSRARREEGGFVLVWMAMVIILLLAVAALAVDLVHAYAVAQRAQNAADAAALAGAIQLPNGAPGCPGAQTQAQKLATNNGFTNGVNGATVTPTCSGPNEMTVDVKSTFGTFFAKAIGFPTLTVHRHAVAQFDAGVRMGSPANNIGNVAACPAAFSGNQCLSDPPNGAQNMWATSEGPSSQSNNGDALTTHWCTTSSPSIDECNAGVNNQENPDGEFYSVHNDGGAFDVWIYDGGFVDTAKDCLLPLSPAWATDGNPDHAVLALNYGNLPAQQPYCSGDSAFTGNDAPFDTKYDVLPPGAADNAAELCSSGWISGYSRLQGDATDLAHTDPNAQKYFHQWQKICPGGIPASSAGDYRIRIQVRGAPGNCLNGNQAACGVNNFSLLAAHGLGNQVGSQLTIFAPEKLPLTAITTGGSTQEFYLARVLPSSRDRTLEVSFFDLGDPGTGSLQLSATTDVKAGYRSALNDPAKQICRYVPPPATSSPSRMLDDPLSFPKSDSTPPWQVKAPCSLPYDARPSAFSPPATWNGRWVVFHITLPRQSDPDGYDCGTSGVYGPQECWIKLLITPAANNNDTTTWNARILGAPARLTG